MSGRSRWQWFAGGEGTAAIASGLLTMAMMAGLIFALAYTTDRDASLSTTASPSATAMPATDSAATGGSTGEAGAQ